MKRIIILGAIILALIGCGKSQAEIEKEKQDQIAAQNAKIEKEKKLKEQVEIKETEDTVRYYLKDGESARFRNVIKNCGEVNAKNGFGAYSGFSRFVVIPEKQVVFQEPMSTYYERLARVYCSADYLKKFPVEYVSESTAAASDAAPIAPIKNGNWSTSATTDYENMNNSTEIAIDEPPVPPIKHRKSNASTAADFEHMSESTAAASDAAPVR